jgi:hypothetical protein
MFTAKLPFGLPTSNEPFFCHVFGMALRGAHQFWVEDQGLCAGAQPLALDFHQNEKPLLDRAYLFIDARRGRRHGAGTGSEPQGKYRQEKRFMTHPV